MMKSIISVLLLCMSCIGYSHSNTASETLKIFYDCEYCDLTFMKQNLKLVEFVRDRKFANVHILVNEQSSGSGGQEYSLTFIGLDEFEGKEDTIKYSISPNMTDDEIRRIELKYVQFGLIPFWLELNLEPNIEMNLTAIDTTNKVEDKWNNWVFRINANGWFNGQESYTNSNINGSVSIRRVTEKNKFNLWSNVRKSKSVYKYEDDTTITNLNSSNFYLSDVISLNDHWSTGVFSDAKTSVYSNYKLTTSARAGIEYNLFPYSESANKQLVAYYTVGPRLNYYNDTTWFNKKDELLFEHQLLVGAAFKQQWGGFSGNVNYKNYLHDFSLNAINFFLDLDVRIYKGLSWNINGQYSIQHNQVNLAKTDVSVEDVLLQQQQLKSGYNYWFNTGVSYSFGSIYNSIVNPRFNF